MKGKSMSESTKLLKRFLCIQSLYSELGRSNCEKDKKEHLLNENEQINDSNLPFPAAENRAGALSFTQ